MGDPRDIELRNAALGYVRELQRRYDDLVPLRALADGFPRAAHELAVPLIHAAASRPGSTP